MNEKTTKICLVCGKQFEPKVPHQRYCSKKCYSKAKHTRLPESAPPKTTCVCCGKEFIPYRWYQKYCSTECYNKKYREDHHEKLLNYDRKRFSDLSEYTRHKATVGLRSIRNPRTDYRRERRHKLYSKGLTAHSLLNNSMWPETPNHPLNIESDLCLLTSDWHIPFDNPEYVGIVYALAEEFNIPTIVIIGDFWDCDNYSRYTQYSVDQTFQDEIKLVTDRLQGIVDFFDHAYFCVGNHEARFLAANATGWARGHLKLKQMMNMTGITEGYTTTDNRWMTLNNEWRLTHPRNYSQIKLSVARRLADKYKMNVVNTHGHYTSGTPPGTDIMKPATHVVLDRDTKAEIGIYKIADIGGLFDSAKMEYLTSWDSTYPQNNPGFAIYDHGEVTIFDLEKYLAEETE